MKKHLLYFSLLVCSTGAVCAEQANVYVAQSQLISQGTLSVTGAATIGGMLTGQSVIYTPSYLQGNGGGYLGYFNSLWTVAVTNTGTTFNGNVTLLKVQGDISMGQFNN